MTLRFFLLLTKRSRSGLAPLCSGSVEVLIEWPCVFPFFSAEQENDDLQCKENPMTDNSANQLSRCYLILSEVYSTTFKGHFNLL